MRQFDADQLSMSGASAYSESQFSSSSGRSGMSGISETSKKSKRQGTLKKQQKQKLKKKRNVKEGSPFEEAYLLELLREETKLGAGDKEEVKDLMKALLNHGFVAESTELHGLVERVMRAEYHVGGLLSLEEQQFIEKAQAQQFDIMAMFGERLGHGQKREEDHKKALAEWKDVKFFKH